MAGPDTNLSGAWNGIYFYPGYPDSVTFVALLIDVGSRFSGSIHEYEGIVSEKRILLYANVDGDRQGSHVSFVKTYDGTGGLASVAELFLALIAGHFAGSERKAVGAILSDIIKRYHHGELREALLIAGRKLLEERGLRGFTLRECARRAQVSHAAPAHHFASVDALLTELAQQGHGELAAAMSAEVARTEAEPVARLVAQGVGYMTFAAAHPMLFRLMFDRDSPGAEPPFAAAVAAVIPEATPEVKARMADFAWSTVHGFIVLVLEGRVGAASSSQALKTRGLAILAAMAETVVRAAEA